MSRPFLLCPVCFSILEHQAPPKHPLCSCSSSNSSCATKCFRIITTNNQHHTSIQCIQYRKAQSNIITWVCRTQGSKFSAWMIIRLYLVSYMMQQSIMFQVKHIWITPPLFRTDHRDSGQAISKLAHIATDRWRCVLFDNRPPRDPIPFWRCVGSYHIQKSSTSRTFTETHIHNQNFPTFNLGCTNIHSHTPVNIEAGPLLIFQEKIQTQTTVQYVYIYIYNETQLKYIDS